MSSRDEMSLGERVGETRVRRQRAIFRVFNLAANVLILTCGLALLVMGQMYRTPWSLRFGNTLGTLLLIYGLIRLLLFCRGER